MRAFLILFGIQLYFYCKIGNFRVDFIFAKLRSFLKIKSSRNGKITLSITDLQSIVKVNHALVTIFNVANMLFPKIKFSRKCLNLQYSFNNVCSYISSSLYYGLVCDFGIFWSNSLGFSQFLLQGK